MKRLSIVFLAFSTFWMSTWMVTDIHDLSTHGPGQPHPIFSVQTDQAPTDQPDNPQHCNVCSYDHGGHIGGTLATVYFVAENIPAQNPINPFQLDFWDSRVTPPGLRPPIA